MNKIINTTKSVIFAKQKTIFSSALLLATTIIIARLFGFLRYRILASYFVKEELDIFFASFRIPDLIFEILITGALTSSFIPIFIKYQKNKQELDKNISSLINLIFIIMLIIVSVVFLLMDKIIPIITPGYEKEKIHQIILFSRLLLVGQLPFLILGNFLTGIGQANKTFFLPSIAPIFYNLSIITATIFLTPQLSLFAPIFGVVIGAFFLFFIQLPILFNSIFTYSFTLEKTTAVFEFMRMIIPRSLTVILAQIDATIDLTLTTFLGTGAYTVFYLAQHLQLLPVSVIGMAFGQASLPYLSDIFQRKKLDELKKIIFDSLLTVIFLTLPFASFFIFARTPVIRFFFGGQKFDWEATVQTALTLSYFAISIPFHSLYYLITRCFYAFLDTRTPFFISLISILFNTTLSLIFIFLLKLPVWSLGISFSVSIIFNVSLLFFLLVKKINGFPYQELFTEVLKMFFSSFIASIISYYSIKFLDGLVFNTVYTINVFFLLMCAGIIYFLLYLFIAWIIEVKQLYLIGKLIGKAREYQKRFIEIYSQYE